jgi:hypothetical protein
MGDRFAIRIEVWGDAPEVAPEVAEAADILVELKSMNLSPSAISLSMCGYRETRATLIEL